MPGLNNITSLLLAYLGVGALVVPLVWIAWGVLVIRKSPWKHYTWSVYYLCLFTLDGALWAQWYWAKSAFGLTPPGGFIGQTLVGSLGILFSEQQVFYILLAFSLPVIFVLFQRPAGVRLQLIVTAALLGIQAQTILETKQFSTAIRYYIAAMVAVVIFAIINGHFRRRAGKTDTLKDNHDSSIEIKSQSNTALGRTFSYPKRFYVWLMGKLTAFRDWFRRIWYPQRRQLPDRTTWNGVEILAVIALVVLGIFFRTHNLPEQPTGCYYDEAIMGKTNQDVLQHWLNQPHKWEGFKRHFKDHILAFPYTYFVLEGILSVSLGQHPVSIRLASVIFGILTIPLMYVFTRLLFDRWAAFLATLFLVVSHWHVNLSRISFGAIQCPFYMLLTAYIFWKGYKHHWKYFLLFPITMLFAFPSYNTSRVIPGVFVVFIVFIGFYRKWFWSKKALYIFLGFLIITIPLFFILKGASRLDRSEITRMSDLFICPSPVTWQDCAKRFWDNVKLYAWSFNFKGDGNPRHNLPWHPQLHFLPSVFFLLGLVYFVYRWKDPRYFFLLLWFLFLMQPAIWSREGPHALRTLGVAPACFIMAGVFLRKLHESFARSAGMWFGLLAIPGILFVAKEEIQTGYDIYFNQMANSQACYEAFDTEKAHVGDYVNAVRETFNNNFHLIMVPSFHGGAPAVRYTAESMYLTSHLDTKQHIPIKELKPSPFVFVYDQTYAALKEQLKFFYPDAVYQEHKSPFHKTEFLSTIITPEQITEILGLSAQAMSGEVWLAESENTYTFITCKFDVEWEKQQLPIPLPWQVRWRGSFFAEDTNVYTFGLHGGEPASLSINGEEVVRLTGERVELVQQQLKLGSGYHLIEITAVESDGLGRLQVFGNEGSSITGLVRQDHLCIKTITDESLRGVQFSKETVTLELLREIPIPKGADKSRDNQIRDLDMDSKGNLYVLQGHYLTVMDQDGELLYELGGYGRAEEQFRNPGGVTVTDEDVIFVVDTWNVELKRFTTDGELEWGKQLALWGSSGVCYDAKEKLLGIADTGKQRVLLASLDGDFIRDWGHMGSGPAEFRNPNDLALRNGVAYVNDYGNKCIKKFDMNGNPIAQWPVEGMNEFSYMDIDSKGNVFVAATRSGEILAFKPDGKQLNLRFEGLGQRPAIFHGPSGMAIEEGDLLLVTERIPRRVLVFQIVQ